MTHILNVTAGEKAKWRNQADRIAVELKARRLQMVQAADPKTGILRVGVVFDDAVVKIPLDTALISTLSTEALADTIYNLILAHTRNTGGGQA